MTKNVEIEGYKTIVPNGVWNRDAGKVTVASVDVPVRELFIAYQYVSPLQADVFGLIQSVANDYNTGNLAAAPKRQSGIVADEDALREILGGFSPDELKLIASGDNAVFEHFKKHYAVNNEHSGSRYLTVQTALVPEKAVDTMPDDFKAVGVLAYDSLLNHLGKDKLSIRIMLGKNTLPDESKMQSRLEDKARETKTISVVPITADYQVVKDQVNFVYASFGSAETLGKVVDLSKSVKVSTAARTMDETSKCLRQQRPPQIMALGPEQLDDLLGGLMGKKGKRAR